MEIAIPALALGTLYIISNQEKKKEAFTSNKLGRDWKQAEYPLDTNIDLHKSNNHYLNPNQRSDQYNTRKTANEYYLKKY